MASPWLYVLLMVRFCRVAPNLSPIDVRPIPGRTDNIESAASAEAGSTTVMNERYSKDRGSRKPARSRVKTAAMQTTARMAYFRHRRPFGASFGACHLSFLNRNEQNWSTAPNGQTQPQTNRPRRNVRMIVTSAHRETLNNSLDARKVVKPNNGSK